MQTEKSLEKLLAHSLIASALCLSLASCSTTVPVVMKWPEVPSQLMEPPATLKPVNSLKQSSTTTAPATKTQKN